MLLTIDVGNTNTCFGVFADVKADVFADVKADVFADVKADVFADVKADVFAEAAEVDLTTTFKISTDKKDSADQLGVKLADLLHANDIAPNEITGVAIACVVPVLAHRWAKYFKKSLADKSNFVELNPKTIRPHTPHLYDCNVDNPDEIGPDYIAAVIAAKKSGNLPAAVFDFGTATNVAFIDKDGVFIGGVIVPGAETSLHALIDKASELHDVRLNPPKNTIGKNTTDCINNGIVLGEAARADGIVQRAEEEADQHFNVYTTGGLSPLISPYMTHKNECVPNLLMYGLREFYLARANN